MVLFFDFRENIKTLSQFFHTFFSTGELKYKNLIVARWLSTFPYYLQPQSLLLDLNIYR